jgi:hypothetical protein
MSVFNSVKVSRQIIAPFEKDTLITNSGQGNGNLPVRYFKASFKSALFPGWGQLSKGDFDKALLLGSSFWVFTGTEFFLVYKTNDIRDRYNNAQSSSEATALYKDYNLFYQLQQGILGVCTGIWIYNVLDALFE